MKISFGIVCCWLIVILVTACSKKEKPLEMNDRTGRNVRVLPVPAMATTALTVWPWNHFTEPFYLDSIFRDYEMTWKDNTGTRTATGDINVFFPQSRDAAHKNFNTAIRRLIDDFYSGYEPGDTTDYGYMSAAMWVSNFQINGDIATTEFIYQSYYQGAAHYNHGFEALNYDFLLDRQIRLSDVVRFGNDEQKQLFCDAYNPDPTVRSDEIFLEPKDLSDNCNFTVEQEGIRLLFDDYEKGPGMATHMIPYSKVKGYINPRYRHIFE